MADPPRRIRMVSDWTAKQALIICADVEDSIGQQIDQGHVVSVDI